MKNVLVTGGAGYIGSHTCKALAAVGLQPVCFDDLSGGHTALVRWGPLVVGDLRDTAKLVATIEQHAIDAVIHFAGRIAVGESVAAPWLHYGANVAGSLSLLEAMRQGGARHLVFSSSAAVYGLPDVPLVSEEMPLQPISPYGRTKLVIEQALRDYAAASQQRAMALRYFNAAGADPDGETGELHEPETHLIPLALTALDGGKPLTVFGDDYDTPDGTCIRDYVHVTDLADAHVRALAALESGDAPAALNVGSGRGYSVREVLTVIEQVVGRAVPICMGQRRAGDPARLVADARRIRQALDWTPAHSTLPEIVASAWAWHRGGAKATRGQVEAA